MAEKRAKKKPVPRLPDEVFVRFDDDEASDDDRYLLASETAEQAAGDDGKTIRVGRYQRVEVLRVRKVVKVEHEITPSPDGK